MTTETARSIGNCRAPVAGLGLLALNRRILSRLTRLSDCGSMSERVAQAGELYGFKSPTPLTSRPLEGVLPMSLEPNLQTAIQTLSVAGYALERVDRKSGFALIVAERVDLFGAITRYCFVLCDNAKLGVSQLDACTIAASRLSCNLIIVGEAAGEVRTLSWGRFIGLLGGPVARLDPFDPVFRDRLVTLSWNRLPEGVDGRPDDLLEVYSRTAFEFILASRVLRYGQDRLFEARPDGIVLPTWNFTALFDSKAYADRFDVSRDAIRQFASYAAEFQQRYSAHLPRLSAFVVVSGGFVQGPDALAQKSHDLIAECGVPLSCLSAGEFVKIIELLANAPLSRRSIAWNRIFAEPVVMAKAVEADLRSIKKDGVI